MIAMCRGPTRPEPARVRKGADIHGSGQAINMSSMRWRMDSRSPSRDRDPRRCTTIEAQSG